MILLNANLLIHAVNADAPNHLGAKTRVDETLAGVRGPVGLAWITVVAFVRIITMPKLMAKPRTLVEALTEIEQWLALPNVTLINPGA